MIRLPNPTSLGQANPPPGAEPQDDGPAVAQPISTTQSASLGSTAKSSLQPPLPAHPPNSHKPRALSPKGIKDAVAGLTLSGAGPAAVAPAPAETADSGGEREVEIGEHSVVLKNVLAEKLTDAPPSSQSFPNFIRSYADNARSMGGNFQFDVNGYVLHSLVTQPTVGAGWRAPVNIQGIVFHTFDHPVAAVNRRTCEVRQRQGRMTSWLEEAPLIPLQTNLMASEKQISSLLSPALGKIDRNYVPALCRLCVGKFATWDNIMVYAKLWYYVGLLRSYEMLGLVPQTNAWPAEPAIPWNWVRTDPAAPDVAAFRAALDNQGLVIFGPSEYSAADLQYLCWLAYGGVRLDGPAEAEEADRHTLHSTYVSWPAIPLTIFMEDDAPVVPAPQLVTAQGMMEFLFRMAACRSEWDDAMRGAYMAFELLGIQYRGGVAGEGVIWSFLRPDLSPNHYELPKPQDYNWVYRKLNATRPFNKEALEEVKMLTTTLNNSMIHLAALYVAMFTGGCTTVLYDNNLATRDLQAWCTPGVDEGDWVRLLLSSKLNNMSINRTSTQESALHQAARSVFPKCYGVTVPTDIHLSAYWLGLRDDIPEAHLSYYGMVPLHPPRLFSVLITNTWILLRPREWGVSGPTPSANLGCDIENVGLPQTRGWYAQLGDSTYNETAVGDQPFTIIEYGVAAANIIGQMLDNPNALPLQFVAAPWNHGSGCARWTQLQDYPAGEVEYLAALRILEPCTLRSIDLVDMIIRAPALTEQAVGQPQMQCLRGLNGQDLPNCGLNLSSIPPPQQAPNFRLPAFIAD